MTSRWDVESANKPRRVYAITPRGRSCLGTWRDTLLDYQRRIGHILAEIPD